MFCPISYNYNPYSKSCLKRHDMLLTWNAAQNFCKARGEYLVMLQTEESAAWLTNAAKTSPGLSWNDKNFTGCLLVNKSVDDRKLM